MLKRRTPAALPQRAGQQGIVLLIALVVLVAIMIGGIAMMRSVDSATLVAGNLAFQQAATHSSDQGIEKAIAMLKAKSAASALDSDDPSNGYFAFITSPAAGTSWQSFWDANLAGSAYDAGTDQSGNHIYFVVQRECVAVSGGIACDASPAVTTVANNSQEGGEIALQSASQRYYRITVRVSGPRRTESYVQSHITM